MDKLTQLFIRACKCKQPLVRLRSLHRRFYLHYDDEELATHTITYALADICDEYLPTPLARAIERVHPDRSLNPLGESYIERWRSFLITRIRFSDIKQFPGLTKPAKMRNQND
jgi:hypothetical protein